MKRLAIIGAGDMPMAMPLCVVWEDVTKLHSIVFHYNVEGFNEGCWGLVWEGIGSCQVFKVGYDVGETLGSVDVSIHRDGVIGEETGIWWEVHGTEEVF